MLPGFSGSQLMAPPIAAGKSLQQILVTELGLSSGLQLLLDAGDAASYAGSGNWLDRSGLGNSFAPVTGASGGDPAFHGAIGGKSEAEYFTVDGSAFPGFQETAAQTFEQNMHRNSGVGTWLALVNIPDVAAVADFVQAALFYCAETTSQIGINWNIGYFSGFGWAASFNVYRGGSPQAYSGGFAPAPQVGWNLLGFSFNEASNVATHYCNGIDEADTCTFASPSTTAAGSIANSLFKNTGAAAFTGLGIGALACWTSYKDASAFDAIYAAIKAGRYPSLP